MHDRTPEFVYDIAMEAVSKGEPTACIPVESGIWVTSMQPVPHSRAESGLVAVAVAVRARREAIKAGEIPLT